MTPAPRQEQRHIARLAKRPDRVVAAGLLVVEYAIIISLLFVAADILIRGVYRFAGADSPTSVVTVIDTILVVVILLDLAHTVFGNLRSFQFTVKPFLVIGVLAGVRDILSASAHLTLLSGQAKQFNSTLISLGVGVGVVLSLLVGLYLLSVAEAKAAQSGPPASVEVSE
jgi:uncharacterized membrane protein (DUF373 family)